MFGAEAYLERIGLAGKPSVSETALAELHLAQLCAIPFENIDVFAGRGVEIDPESVWQKAVERRRGGYCFELNGLFLRALEAFGYEARPLLGRVHMGPVPFARTHQVSLVRLAGRLWLADAGFGVMGIREPLPLEHGRVAEQGHQRYRLVDCEPWGTALEQERDGGWQRLYSFDLTYPSPADLHMGNHYTSMHPDSIFRRTRIVSRFTPEGRVSLVDGTLTRVANGVASESAVADGPDYDRALAEHFGLDPEA